MGNQEVKNLAGAVVENGTQDGISVDYDPGTGTADFTNTDKGSVAVAAHEAEADPHPQYTTDAEATALALAEVNTHRAELHAHDAAQIDVPASANSGYLTVQDFLNVMHSPGQITGGVISVTGPSQVTVSAGTGILRAADDDVSELKFVTWPATVLTIPNDSTTRHIGVQAVADANGAQVVLKTSFTWDKDTEFPLGTAVQINSIVFPFSNPYRVGDPITNIIQRFDAVAPALRDSDTGGLFVSNVGTRNIQVTAGRVWFRLNDKDFPGLDTSVSGGFGTTYYNGTNWVYSPGLVVTQWPNTQYNDITSGLVSITGSRYVNHWFYLGIDGAVILMLYGQNQWVNLSDALSEGPPSFTPTNLPKVGLLLGRLTFRNGDSTPTAITSAFTTVFNQTPITDHGTLAGLGDDDHPQYHTDARGDLRYAPIVHNHTASEVTDFAEAVDDRVAALLVAGTNISLVYDDALNTLTISATGGGGGVTDHGALTGLADDDHPQYHNDARGDARYLPIANPTFTGSMTGPQIKLTQGSTGITANSQRNGVVIEDDGSQGLSILTPNGATGGIAFGDPENAVAGQIRYNHTDNTMDFVVNGTVRMVFSTTAIDHRLQSIAPNGSASAPTYSFSSDMASGLYRPGAGEVGISALDCVATWLSNTGGNMTYHVGDRGGNAYLLIQSGGSSLGTALSHVTIAGASALQVNSRSIDGTSASTIQFNRATNTSGAVNVDMLRGNNSTTIDHRFTSGTAGTLVQLCRNGGQATVAGSRILTTADASVLEAGTWAPTVTAVANVAAASAPVAGTYIRVGDVVTCQISLDIDPTAASTSTTVAISLPVASNIASFRQCTGSAIRLTTAGLTQLVASMTGDSTNDRINLTFINDADVANRSWTATFQYVVA